MAHDVFISYSSKDKPVADAACAVLESKGIRCWVAPRDIVPGADWGASIVRAISEARLFVLVFSSNANASPQIKREVERAVNRGIPLIPVRIENVPPGESLEYFINTPHWLDAFTPPIEAHLTYLASVAEHILKDAPPPARVPPSEPVRRSWTAALGLDFARWRFGITVSLTTAALLVFLGPAAYFWMALHSPTAAPPPATPSGGGSSTVAAAPAPDANLVKLDFASIDTMSAPSHTVAADPYLHAAPIAIAVTQRDPENSTIVFMNNVALYNGRAVAPTVSQNFLTQQGTDNKPASFTLTLSQPVEQVTFTIPKVFPDTPSGVTFPAWRATALSASGEELSSVSEKLLRRFADFPAQSYTLNAPGFEGIAAIKFESDPRLNGKPFAGFSTILIESLTLTRKAAPPPAAR